MVDCMQLVQGFIQDCFSLKGGGNIDACKKHMYASVHPLQFSSDSAITIKSIIVLYFVIVLYRPSC